MKRPLEGRVALVAGATRGAGRGIALELGLAGAIVYCTGRSTRAVPRPRPDATASPFALSLRPEAIEDTADLVNAGGGRAIAVRVDHTQEEQVRALVDRIRREQGRLDALVDDVWGGDELTEWGKRLWEIELGSAFVLLERAVHTHLVTLRHALPLMLEGDRGLVVEVTDGAGMYYRGNALYDLAKTSVIRLAFSLAEELRGQKVAAVAVTPGFLRSEAMLEHFGVTEETWRDAIVKDPHFAWSETPRYVGRAVAALAADPALLARSGRGFGSWDLAREYGFTDVDGRSPDWGAHAAAEGFGAEHAASHARFAAMFADPASPREK